MKKILTAIVAGATLMTAVSCEGFLTTNPTSSVSDASVFLTTQGAEAALSGCYNLLSFGNYGGRPDTQGYASQIMTFDVDGEDIIVWGGWYGYDYNHWGHQRGDIFKSTGLWRYYYSLINNLNSVIYYTPKIDGGLDSDKDAIVGQALAMRGWAYFNLAQLYQHTYALSAPRQMPGVPIYTEPSSDQTEGKGRGTINETFDQILDDLKKAESLLDGYSRTQKNHFDKSVVEGLLARVYLVMNDWDNAASYASKARAGYPLTTNDQWNAGFNDAGTSSWMWAMLTDTEHTLEANGDYGPFAMWANWKTRNGGDLWSFNCFYVNDKFANLFDEDDIRGKQIYWKSDIALHCSEKFYDTPTLEGDFVFMRADEMLLIEAEALAHKNDPKGLQLLNDLRTMRGAKTTNSTGQSLLDEILIERRKELYGEGFAWLDMIRCQKPLVRGGNHANFSGDVQIPARSWRFVYQIPTGEILNNPNINSDIWPDGDQNPFGSYDLVLE